MEEGVMEIIQRDAPTGYNLKKSMATLKLKKNLLIYLHYWIMCVYLWYNNETKIKQK